VARTGLTVSTRRRHSLVVVAASSLGVAVVSSVTDAQTRREQGEEALCGKGKNGGRKGGGGDGADPFIPMWQGGSGGGQGISMRRQGGQWGGLAQRSGNDSWLVETRRRQSRAGGGSDVPHGRVHTWAKEVGWLPGGVPVIVPRFKSPV
jgi:hypothetical protein